MLKYFVNLDSIKVSIHRIMVKYLPKKIKYLYLRRILDNFLYLFESKVEVYRDYKATLFDYTSTDSIDLSHGFNSRNVFVIRNSVIDPLTGQVFVKDLDGRHALVSESSSWDPPTSLLRLKNRDSATSRKPLRTFKSPMQYLKASPFPGYNGYYHWLIEDLPAFLRVFKHRPDITFITGGRLAHRCREVMDILESKYVESNSYVHCDFVYFAERGQEKALAHPFDLNLIRDFSSMIYPANLKTKPMQTIFLKRAKLAEENRSLNISNSILLLDYEVIFIEPERMSLVDLIAVLSKATTVIGFHGGNLANIVLVENIQNCIEIVNDNFQRGIDVVKWICSIKQINYFRISFNSQTTESDLLNKIFFILDEIK